MTPKEVLKAFADNPLLFETVRSVILNKFRLDDAQQLVGLEDKKIGEVIRARLDGRAKVEEAFKELSNYKTTKQRETIENPAR